MQPIEILKEAIKKVPAMRYALAVAGIVAVVAIVASFQLEPKIAVIGGVLVLGAMVVMVIFAKLTTTAKKHFLRPVLVMMWAFLVLVIVLATLLLTAVAFRWPPGLADWLFPRETTAAVTAEASDARSEIPSARLDAIQMQAAAGDYPAAWAQVNEALKESPDSERGLRLQAEIAMGWIRQRFGYEEGALVDTLSPSLYRAASSADKQFAADAHAHIGWGNYLKTRAGSRLGWEVPFSRAIEIDPTNTYAHAMWGYILLWTDLARFGDAMAHFDSALESGRERAYIRELQLATLAQQRFDDRVFDLIRIVDEMRRGGETLSTKMRGVIVWHAYQGNWEMIRATINSSSPVLPPAEHLATIEWLADGGKPLHPYGQFFVARLKEQLGDRSAALAIYRAMNAVENPGSAYTDLASEIKQGIARCTM